jgi:Asp-tRNA(Asn)/Glu-tRNA(Gln) amidotransferase A subunit family amidase
VTEELTMLSATELAALIHARTVSPVEAVEAYLRRIESLNPKLNAIVTHAAEHTLGLAREAEAAITRGEGVGALLGVPLTVKDTIETHGMRATAGSKVRAGHVPRADAPSVARLRAAGAIIIGKTNTSELALEYNAENPVFGRTNNPHDLARTPGGSSGGCAAAVAACLSAGSLGSDLAGSVRIPAHFCGVVGFRPTAGRVPTAGHFPPVAGPYSLGASLGPLARTVADAATLYDVLAGRNDDAGALRVEELRGQRAAIFTDDGKAPVTDETREAVVRAAEALKDAGLVVVDERPPGFERATDLWLSLFSRETQRIVCAAYKGREGEAGRAAQLMIDSAACGTPATLEDFLDAWSERDRLRAALLEWMERTPLVVMPVGAITAFEHEAQKHFVVGEKGFGLFRAFGYAQSCNVFDLPAVSVPAGRTREGLPVGVQIVGRPFEERCVLAAARVIESATGGWQPPRDALSNA